MESGICCAGRARTESAPAMRDAARNRIAGVYQKPESPIAESVFVTIMKELLVVALNSRVKALRFAHQAWPVRSLTKPGPLAEHKAFEIILIPLAGTTLKLF